MTATQQHYRDALSGGFISGVIGYTASGEAAGYALYSWFFETAAGLPAMSILDLYSATALKEGRTVLDRELFSACCAIATEHKAGLVEWRVDANDTRAVNMAKNVGAQPVTTSVLAIAGPENVAIAARLTDQPTR